MYLLPAVFVAAFLFWLFKSLNAAFLLLQPMPRSLSALVKEGDIPGALFYVLCIWVSIIKTICHEKIWSGTSAEGPGLVQITWKGSSGADSAKDLQWDMLKDSAESLCFYRATSTHSAKSFILNILRNVNRRSSVIIISLGLSYQFWYEIFRGNLFSLNVWAALHTMKPSVSSGSSCNTNKLQW